MHKIFFYFKLINFKKGQRENITGTHGNQLLRVLVEYNQNQLL